MPNPLGAVASLQAWVILGIGVAAFGLEVWACVDALIRPAPAYPAAGKASKTMWVALTAVAAVIGFGSASPFGAGPIGGIAAVAAVIVAIVYLVDVRPAVRGARGGPRRPPSRPSGGW
ncbi:MAG: DUF2516 family protein [Bifidobacteriaceae bacterium]|jgi:hypothetical protein|nr:DUF2516 family protein [Bifidobacteriaceae bacterium]